MSGSGVGSHLTGLRRGLMAVMTGFCMYQKVRLPLTHPRRSRRTHTGTGTGREPPGTVQAMLVSVRLWEGSGHPQQDPHLPLLGPAQWPIIPGHSHMLGLGLRPPHRAPAWPSATSNKNLFFSVFPLPHLCLAILPTLNRVPSLEPACISQFCPTCLIQAACSELLS